MKKCPNCGALVNEDYLFCTECGNKFPQGNVCPHCGTLVKDGDVFCRNCGKKLDGQTDIKKNMPLIKTSEENITDEEYDTSEENVAQEHTWGINELSIWDFYKIIRGLVVVIIIGLGLWLILSKDNDSSTKQSEKTDVKENPITDVKNEVDTAIDNDSYLEESEEAKESEVKEPVYFSSISFKDSRSILDFLANKIFIYEENSRLKFNEKGMVSWHDMEKLIYADEGLVCDITPQSAVLRYYWSGDFWGGGRKSMMLVVQIEGDKVQIISEGTKLYQMVEDEADVAYNLQVLRGDYASYLKFSNKESVISLLSGERFKTELSSTDILVFENDGGGYVYDNLYHRIDKKIEKLKVLSYASQSAVIEFYNRHWCVQIVKDHLLLRLLTKTELTKKLI